MQQKKLAKVNPFPDYIRVSDPNMELLSAYTILAKGEDRSLNDFAKDCGVSTSTLSRLINKKNNKPNSDSLISKIIENIDPNSEVTEDMILSAHGLAKVRVEDGIVPEDTSEIVKEASKHFKNRQAMIEELCRDIMVFDLHSKGYKANYNVEYNFRDNIILSTKELRYAADFSIETDAFEGVTKWAFDVYVGHHRPLMHKLSWLFGAAYIDSPLKNGIKVSLILTDADEFNKAKERLETITINDMVSIILIDIDERKIVEEYEIHRGGHTIYGSSTDKGLRAFYELNIDPASVKEVYVFFEEWDAKLYGFYNVDGVSTENKIQLTDAPHLIIITDDEEYWFNGFTCGYSGQGCGGTQEVLYKLGILKGNFHYIDNEIASHRVMHYYKSRGKWQFNGEANSKRDIYSQVRSSIEGNEFLYSWNGKLVLAQSLRKEHKGEPSLEWMRASDYFLKHVKSVTFLSKSDAKKEGRYETLFGEEVVYQIIVECMDNRELWLTYSFEELGNVSVGNLMQYLHDFGIDLEEENSQSLISKLISGKKSIFRTYNVEGV